MGRFLGVAGPGGSPAGGQSSTAVVAMASASGDLLVCDQPASSGLDGLDESVASIAQHDLGGAAPSISSSVVPTTEPGALSGLRTVRVGPFRVADVTGAQLVDRLARLSTAGGSARVLAFALHVGGLNERGNPRFVSAMQQADVVYADGGSVVWLGRLADASSVERAATTDIGWDVMREVARRLGRVPRVSLVGGPEGLAQRAAGVLETAGVAEVVHTAHGYHDDWTDVLSEMRDQRPDITVIGLGAPREMIWSIDHRDELPTGLVLTCGGWFGHLVGDERRAPAPLRRSGLEWIARVAQSPRRLGPRYARGLVSTLIVASAVLRAAADDVRA